MNDRPKVGIGVIVTHENKVLWGKRTSELGKGTWCFLGGHLEFGEEINECARREVREEAGVEITNLRPGPVTNDVFHDSGKHYVTIYVISDLESGVPSLVEPDKWETWEWRKWGDFPEPLFVPVKNLLKIEFNPFNMLQYAR